MVCIKKYRLPELLAPAGSFEHLTSAIKAGADAVYLGGNQFGARAYAGNFTRDELIRAIYYAHFYEKKVYLTINTLMKEKELKDRLYSFLFPFYQAGLDGVIVQDMGTASFIRKHFPDLPIHGSTQMTITSGEGALAAKRMGMQRVVLARELSLPEIAAIKEKTGMELEIFIHGALCYCYSGQCLLSSVYGGRSGNRGKCAQPCRLPYELFESDGRRRKTDGNYLLSPKDLCSLELLPEIIAAGADSLKIEGRMKNPEYVAGVTEIYRKYLDYYGDLSEKEKYRVNKKDTENLKELFSRSGFSSGYFEQHNGNNMMSVKRPNHLGRKIGAIESVKKNKITFIPNSAVHARDILVIPLREKSKEETILTVPKELDGSPAGARVTMNASGMRNLARGMDIYRRKNTELSEHIQNEMIKKEPKRPVKAAMEVKKGNPTILSLRSGEWEVSLKADPPEIASGKGISKEDILKQLKKTGTVPFALKEAEIDLEDNLFLPLSMIKGLRQEGYARLEEKIKKAGCRKVFYENPSKHNLPFQENYDMIGPKLILTVYSLESLRYCLLHFKADGYCLPMDFFDLPMLKKAADYLRTHQKEVYFSLPRIVREKDFSSLSFLFEDCFKDCGGYYVHNINEAEFLAGGMDKRDFREKMKKRTVVFASSLYQWNSGAAREVLTLYQKDFGKIKSEYPMELSFREAQEALSQGMDKRDTEVLLYGHFPVMVSAQCVNRTTKGCTGIPETLWLGDSNHRRLPVTTHCRGCYNLIWSDQPRNWFLSDEITENNCPGRVRIDLFHRDKSQTDKVMEQYGAWKQRIFGTNI